MTIIDLETALGKQQNDAPTQAQTRDRNDESAQVHGSRPETPNNRDVREGTPLSVTPSPSSPSRTEPTLAQPRGGKVKLPKLTLRKFSGDPTAWTPFWDSYESAIHRNPDLSDIDKFNYLQSLVEHSAAEAIAGLTLELWRSHNGIKEAVWEQAATHQQIHGGSTQSASSGISIRA